MCFGKKPKLPKAEPTPQIVTPPTTPIEQQAPQTQSGADQAASQQKPRKKSLFEIDLTIPTTGVATSTPTTAGGQSSSAAGTGAATR